MSFAATESATGLRGPSVSIGFSVVDGKRIADGYVGNTRIHIEVSPNAPPVIFTGRVLDRRYFQLDGAALLPDCPMAQLVLAALAAS
jgi:hypothetical protein